MLLICVSWVLIISVSAQQELPMPAIPSARALHHESIANSLNTILTLPDFRDDRSNVALDHKYTHHGYQHACFYRGERPAR
jgi:hypothetical protein